MEYIFHEKQDGSLCAQHCLNTLLQSSYFTAVDLADIATRLDEYERSHMAEGGLNSEDFEKLLKQPSLNFDDSGYFSIQVLQRALQVWNLELIPFNGSSEICILARQDPTTQMAYICNFRDHWFTIRRLGTQWFNLNSLLSGPELLSDTYLSLFLTQLQEEGYTVFIVVGNLPDCDADKVLEVMPAVQRVKPHLLANASSANTDSDDLQQAIALSKQLEEDEDMLLKKALELSMQGMTDTSESQSVAGPSREELRERRLRHLQSDTASGEGNEKTPSVEDSEPKKSDAEAHSEQSDKS